MCPRRFASGDLCPGGQQRIPSDANSRSDFDRRDCELQAALWVAQDNVTIQAHSGPKHNIIAEVEILAVQHHYARSPIRQSADP